MFFNVGDQVITDVDSDFLNNIPGVVVRAFDKSVDVMLDHPEYGGIPLFFTTEEVRKVED
ncbi:hypothetical protein [Streptomyces sp. NPDC002644]